MVCATADFKRFDFSICHCGLARRALEADNSLPGTHVPNDCSLPWNAMTIPSYGTVQHMILVSCRSVCKRRQISAGKKGSPRLRAQIFEPAKQTQAQAAQHCASSRPAIWPCWRLANPAKVLASQPRGTHTGLCWSSPSSVTPVSHLRWLLRVVISQLPITTMRASNLLNDQNIISKCRYEQLLVSSVAGRKYRRLRSPNVRVLFGRYRIIM